VASPDAAWLLPLAESIADGTPIDWDAAETRANADERAMLRELRLVASLALLHRSLPRADSASSGRTIPGHAAAVGAWGHLKLLERLGSGTAGEVYRAWDPQLQYEVALKLLRSVDAHGDSGLSPLVKEGRLLARVRHPNVVTVHGVAVHEGRFGLWMELVRGETLEQLLARRGPFSAREASLIGIDLCRALAAIHGAGLIHRDIKAQNVMRQDGGRIVLMDLGTGRDIDPDRGHGITDLAGTPMYLAPEIFEGESASQRSDVYSVGVLLYRLVTGSFPVKAATFDELVDKHAAGSVVRLRDQRADLPTAFVRVVDRATSRDPAERYGTAGELEADLDHALDTDVTRAASAAPERRPLLRAGWAAAALVGLVLLSLGWRAFRPVTPVAPAAIRSIAVLPLDNLGDPSQQYFADAMTDELIATLGQMGGFNVISRTSAIQFRNSQKTLPEIAKELHADAIVEGSVLILPGSLPTTKRARINARLVHAAADEVLWTKDFESVVDDVIALQNQVAKAVVEGIHVQLTPDQRRELVASEARNPEAQDAYLLGRSYLTNSSRESLTKAEQSLQRAITLDPQYARAHAALAIADIWLELVGALPRDRARALASASATRALQLDPDLAEAHGALADIKLFYDWDWAGAGAAYRRALDSNPSYSFARGRYAWYLAALARFDESLQQARLAEEVDPLSAEAKGAVGMMLYFMRRYDEALAQLGRARDLAPGGAQEHNGLGRVYAAKGQFPAAIEEIRQALRLSGDAPPYLAALATVHAASGDSVRARDLLAQLERLVRGRQVYVPPQSFAAIYAALGDRDRAFRLLNDSVDQRDPAMLWAQVDPALDPLRGDPRFDVLIRRMAIPR
jgi:serine/threonine-protein kinase